jgi:phosphotriesterase-related protein
MTQGYVQTVTGPVKIAELGRTLMHEHILISNPGVEYDPKQALDRPALVKEAVKRLKELRELGISTFVDPCPIELGRDVTLLKEISEKSGMNIICATGFYFEARGLPFYWRHCSVDEIAELYIREIETGVADTGVRAGLLKCATGAPKITALEDKFLTAATIAHKATGTAILTHTEDGLCGPEQQQIFGREGVELHRCLIGHCCGSADGAYHRRVVDAGSYIGFDRIGSIARQPDEARADGVVRLIDAGFQQQIMLSQDRICSIRGAKPPPHVAQWIADLTAQGQWPPPYTHIFKSFFPLLRARGVSDAQIASILEDNPRRFFSGERPTRADTPAREAATAH